MNRGTTAANRPESMISRARRRLRSASGESFAETLIALLISALALVMLAGAVGSAVRTVTASDQKLSEYYGEDAKLVAMTGTASCSMTIKIASSDATAVGHLEKGEEHRVNGFTNPVFTGKSVVSYKVKTS